MTLFFFPPSTVPIKNPVVKGVLFCFPYRHLSFWAPKSKKIPPYFGVGLYFPSLRLYLVFKREKFLSFLPFLVLFRFMIFFFFLSSLLLLLPSSLGWVDEWNACMAGSLHLLSSFFYIRSHIYIYTYINTGWKMARRKWESVVVSWSLSSSSSSTLFGLIHSSGLTDSVDYYHHYYLFGFLPRRVLNTIVQYGVCIRTSRIV